MGPSLIYLLLLGGVLVGGRKLWREKLLLLGWFLVPLAVQAMFAKTFTARYILFTLPPIYVLAGQAFAGKSRIILKASAVLLVAFVLQAGRYDYFLLTNPPAANLPRSERSGYLEEWTAGTGIAEVAKFIETRHLEDPSGKIVVGTEGYFGTLPDGLQMYLEGVENVTVIGIGLGIKGVPGSLRESRDAGNRTYLVANTSRLEFESDPALLGLRLVESYPKAYRPMGYKEYVQHGERDFLELYEVVED
jgi:hypothetical protein